MIRLHLQWPIRVSNSRHAAPLNGVLTPNLSGAQPGRPTVRSRLTDVEDLTRGILFITVVSLIGIVVTLDGVVLDQWRYNTATFQEETAASNSKVEELNMRVKILNEQLRLLQSQQDNKLN